MPQAHTHQKFRVQFRNAAQEGSETVVEIFDVLDDWWGYGLPRLAYQLHGHTEPIRVRVNSYGGDLTSGIAIMNYLRAYPGRVTAEVLGVAASAATFILAGADHVTMAPGSFLMIHNPWAMPMGDASELDSAAATLRKMEGEMSEIYLAGARKRKKMAGMDDAAALTQIRAWMEAETWFTPAEALDNGFIDEIADGEETVSDTAVAAAANAMTNYFNTPQRILNMASKEKTPVKKTGWAAFLAGMKSLIVEAEAEAAPAETETPATEAAAPAVDPVEAAKQLLQEQGYTVAEAAAGAPDPDDEEEETPVAAPAPAAVQARYTDEDLQAKIAAALAAEKTRQQAAANPANQPAPAKPSGVQARKDAIRARALPKFNILADAVKAG